MLTGSRYPGVRETPTGPCRPNKLRWASRQAAGLSGQTPG